MFFGKAINSAQPFHFTDENLQPNASHTLMITNIVLTPESQSPTSLLAKNHQQQIIVTTLTSEKPQSTLRLSMTLIQNITLMVRGNGTIHVLGYYEPSSHQRFPIDLPNQLGPIEQEQSEEEELQQKPSEMDDESMEGAKVQQGNNNPPQQEEPREEEKKSEKKGQAWVKFGKGKPIHKKQKQGKKFNGK